MSRFCAKTGIIIISLVHALHLELGVLPPGLEEINKQKQESMRRGLAFFVSGKEKIASISKIVHYFNNV